MEMFCDARRTTRQYGRYIDDVRRLFVFHGLSCGTPENFEAVASKLAQNRAFRTDVSALARSISDLENGRIPVDEMLTVIALASGGEELVAGGHASPIATSKTAGMILMLLAEACAWGKRNQAESASPQELDGSLGESVSERKAHLDASHQQIERRAPGLSDTAQLGHTLSEPCQRPAQGQHEEAVPAQNLLPAPTLISRQAAAPVSQFRIKGEGVIARGMEAAAAERNDVRASSTEREAAASMPPWAAAEDDPLPAFHQKSIEEMNFASTQERCWTESQTTPPLSFPDILTPKASVPSQGAPAPVALLQEAAPLITQSTAMAPNRDSPHLHPESSSLGANAEHSGPVAKPMTELVPHRLGHTSARQVLGKLFAVVTVMLVMVGIYGLAVSARHPAGERGPGEGSSQSKAIPSSDQGGGKVSKDSIPAQPVQRLNTVETAKVRDVAVPGTHATSTTRPSVKGSMAFSNPPSASGAGETSAKAQIIAKPAETMKLNIRDKEPQAFKEKTPVTPNHVPETIAAGRTSLAKETPLVVPSSAMKANLISAKEPVYPPDALRQHLEGTVILNTFIAQDGTVRRMDVVEGPSVFIKSAVAATSWRRYKPYLVHGKPVEVETLITVKYPPH